MTSWLPTEEVRMRFIMRAIEGYSVSYGCYANAEEHTGGQEVCHCGQDEERLDKRIDARGGIRLQVLHHDRSRERDVVSYD